MAYVVQSGEVEIFNVIEGNEVILGTVGQGGISGEMTLFDANPRMAGARPSKGSTIIIVTRAKFDQKMAKADPFIKGLFNILVDKIRTI